MNIYKNFLDKSKFKDLQLIIMGDSFPWYFNTGINKAKDGFFQFTFIFMRKGKLNCSNQIFDILKPILSKLKHKKMLTIKANLLTKDVSNTEHGMHTDQKKGTTGIFYINTCDGYTKFKNGKKIKSEENKYVEFNSVLKHTGSTCTDKDRRVVINFNY